MSARVRTAAALMIMGACGTPESKRSTPEPLPSAGTGVETLDVCVETNAPPRALRLLTRREYANTIDDLFAWLDGGDPTSCSTHTDCRLASESCLSGACRPDPCDTFTVVVDATVADADTSVVLAGDFNGWAPTRDQGGWALEWSPSHEAHWGKFTLDEGTWHYKLVLNGETWLTDPSNPETTRDAAGNENSVAYIDCSGSDTDGAPLVADIDPMSDFPAESRPAHHPFDNAVESGLVTTNRAAAFHDAAETLADQVVDRSAQVVGCSLDRSVASESDCWEDFLANFGERAWRRPLTDTERARLLDAMEGEASTSDGLSLAIQMLLTSPHFLYRMELGVRGSSGLYRLDGYETATLLAYTLWGTTPDTELLSAAADGSLGTTEGIAAQAGRLLDDPRGATRFGGFTTAWLGVDAVPTLSRNPALYPEFTPALGQAMVDEVAARAARIVLEDRAGLRALLTGTDTTVDAELADIYGIDGPASGWTDATVPADRPGVLGTPAWLTATAHSDQTSPVRRGLFVRERILCQSLGTPPADAGGVPDVDPDASTRDRFSQHADDPACSSCHQYIDPVGFGFEHLDSIGRWRTEDGTHPVDASGLVTGLEGIGQADNHPFYGLGELAPILASSHAASHCFVEMSWRHAIGQSPDSARCAIDQLDARFDADRPIRDLLLTLVATDAFVLRSDAVEDDR